MSKFKNDNGRFGFENEHCSGNDEIMSENEDDCMSEDKDEIINKHYEDIRTKDTSFPKKRPSTHKKLEHNYSQKHNSTVKSKSQFPSFYLIIFVFLLIAGISMAAAYFNRTSNDDLLNLEELKKEFPTQADQFWPSIISGISETLKYDQPSTFILIHERNGEATSKKLVEKITEYATCRLSHCENQPIRFDIDKFNNVEDYGWFLTHFKNDLENSRVMLIENIDRFPGKHAIAFHFFCDEVAPLVKKTAFFFTIEVDKFAGTLREDMANVEKKLRRGWSNVEKNEFHPLFARISGMVLRIHP